MLRKNDSSSPRTSLRSDADPVPIPGRSLSLLKTVVPLLLLAVVLAGCTRGINPISGNTRALGWSWEEEVRIGKEADEDIQEQFGRYDDEEVEAYVERVGESVLQHSHLRREDTPQKFRETDFYFRVLDSPIVNAFALPGGYNYVTRGLLAHLSNEAQLAMVLGHEIGHVAGRHASQRAARQQIAQVGLIAGAVGADLAGLPGGDVLQLGGMATQLLFLSYSRDNEREADRVGVEYASLEGYQAGEGSEFFRTLQRLQEEAGQGGLPTWQSTHPDPGNREREIERMAREWSERTEMTRVGQEDYMEAIDGMIFGNDPREGYTQDGNFNHPELQFQFPVPPNYQVINQPNVVAMLSPDERAVIQFSFAEGNTPREAAQRIKRADGTEVVNEGEMSSSDLPGYFVTVDRQAENQRLRIMSYYVAFDDRIYNFRGISGRDDFGDYRSTFTNTMRGFAELTDPDLLNVEPHRLSVEPAGRTDTFRSFVPDNLPNDMTPQRLAIINQVNLDDTIEQGTLLKIPRQ